MRSHCTTSNLTKTSHSITEHTTYQSRKQRSLASLLVNLLSTTGRGRSLSCTDSNPTEKTSPPSIAHVPRPTLCATPCSSPEATLDIITTWILGTDRLLHQKVAVYAKPTDLETAFLMTVHLIQIQHQRMTGNMVRPDAEDQENRNSGNQRKRYRCLTSWLTVCTGEKRECIPTTILVLSFGLGGYFSSSLWILLAGLKKTT